MVNLLLLIRKLNRVERKLNNFPRVMKKTSHDGFQCDAIQLQNDRLQGDLYLTMPKRRYLILGQFE